MARNTWIACCGLLFMMACNKPVNITDYTRNPVDTIGFTQYAWQMDSVMARIAITGELQSTGSARIPDSVSFRLAICPHDDYTYAGPLYSAVLKHIKAPVVILFGVAHKARVLGIENRLVFDRYSAWKEPYGSVVISSGREEIIRHLDTANYMISDTLQKVEHSLEALVPFLQYYNRNLQIIPILVPAMPFDRMQQASADLADAIGKWAGKNGLLWGKDYALVISTDAVHYGDIDWGGKNYAPYGADSAGYFQAIQHEMEIVYGSLTGKLQEEKIRNFNRLTVDQQDYHEYLWTWCGRYSVPAGLLTAYDLSLKAGNPLQGNLIGYASSIDHPRLKVEDLHMGITAGASLRHWVGYAAVGYK